MRKRSKLFLRRIAAGFMAAFIVVMSFLPVVSLAAGNFQTGNFTPGNFNSGTFSTGSFSPGNFTPGTFTPGTFAPGTFTPGTFAPGEFSPGDFAPGQFTPGQFAPGEFNQGETSQGQFTPGTTTPGNFTDGGPSTNPGEGSDGNYNPSPFNPPGIDLPGNVEHPNGNPGNFDPNGIDQGNPKDSESPRFPFEDDPNYNTIKFITDSLVFPAIEGLDKHTLVDIDWDKYGQDFHSNLSQSIVKNQLGDMFKDDSLLSGIGNLGLDVWSGVDHAKHLGEFFNSWTDIKNAWSAATTGGSFSGAASNAGSFISNATKSFDMGTGIAGKAAPWMAAISTGISGAETIMNFANGNNVDGFASLGETLMSGAVVLSATGVGAPVAAGVAVVGGLLWTGAMVVKHKDTIVKAAKKVGDGIKKAAKVVGDTVKGGIDAVKSGFKKVAGWFG
ncbi:hypothetical protein J2Z40_002328 [Cytobacillus eiseniae]|uniref:Uncharacterized protein n=1 Tax=Cytobacillus eiseniae TaxID=762947 RepID=A0ABS4RFS7_9BACI|nr:hypothetical protein [Cytobacillus eiseniae]MBP2241756.1 hypothetical protein [Cytobacillus eiseniae]